MTCTKRIVSILLALALFLSSVPCTLAAASDAEILEENGFLFTVADGEATVVGGPDGTEIIIPDTLGGCPVTAIADAAFSGRSDAALVVIPDTVRAIGNRSFFWLPANCRVILPTSLESIGESCFGSGICDCVDLPNLKHLGMRAFMCLRIRRLLIGGTITEIPYGAFSTCGIEELEITAPVASIDSVAFSGNSIQTLLLPDTVTQLGHGAFSRCGIESLTLPASLEVIGIECFSANALRQVVLPDSLTFLGENAFRDCGNLEKVITGGNIPFCSGGFRGVQAVVGPTGSQQMTECLVNGIPYYDVETGAVTPCARTVSENGVLYSVTPYCAVVVGCEADVPRNLVIASAVEGQTVTEIWASALKNQDIRSIVIPDGVRRIGFEAFAFCPFLNTVRLPETIEYIGEQAFYGTDVYVAYIPASLKAIVPREYGEVTNNPMRFFFGEKTIYLYYPGSTVAPLLDDSVLSVAIEPGKRYYTFRRGVYSTTDGKTLRTEKLSAESYDRLVIPDRISGMRVTAIGADSLVGNVSVLEIGFCTETIEDYACRNLKFTRIYIPENVSYMGDQALGNHTIYGFAVYCYKGSYAESRAKELSWPVIFIPKHPYTDVPDDAWYHDAVLYTYRYGIMSGTSATSFSPNAPASRAMLVQILHNMIGAPDFPYDMGFSDVKAGSWYAEAVNWAAYYGIVSGTGDGRFSPGAPVTRGQTALILKNMSEAMGLDTSARTDLSGYTDAAKIPAYAEDALSWAVASGLIGGKSGNNLDTSGICTRAQTAQIMKNYIAWVNARLYSEMSLSESSVQIVTAEGFALTSSGNASLFRFPDAA